MFFSVLKRLFGKIYLFNPKEWFPLLMEGISIELDRVREFKNDILLATVPSKDLPSFSISDHENKYGVFLRTGTDEQRINRILERADLNGLPGPDWLEKQVQTAGFPLYVIENLPLEQSAIQYGDVQYGNELQYGISQRFLDADLYPGELIVNSPFEGIGKAYTAQYGQLQYGDIQYGDYDLSATNPQPKPYIFTTDPSRYGFYFWLSPDPDNIVSTEAGLLEVSQEEFNYLKKLVIGSKLTKNWAIAQVKVV